MNTLIHTTADVSSQQLSDIITAAANRGTVIFDGRNKLISVPYKGNKLVVKRFASGIKNKLVYAIFKSKAHKSFANATELAARGIGTPAPIGYAECRGKFNTLLDSYYVCEYDSRESLKEGIEKYGRECLSAFAAFVADLHANGIIHKDLNNTNVRVAYNNQFSFTLIDLNRMQIYPRGEGIPLHERFANLCRFSYFDKDFKFFFKEYLRCSHLPQDYFNIGVSIKSKHEARVALKKRIKHPCRNRN
ncbi:MAG: lipopolysaccharide kinase InaA family protein [Muribaculaceae bacterium]|nr:lipopolysaccharide kinase InaA family protein [Muribaculaceae bacterium]